MHRSKIVQMDIGSAIVQGSAVESAAVILLWKEINGFFLNRPFTAANSSNAELKKYNISLNAQALITVMEKAVSNFGDFDKYLGRYTSDERVDITATLYLEVVSPLNSEDDVLPDLEVYAVTTLFFQQLIMTINLVLPGAFQILQASFKGAGAYLYEVQSYDSKIFYGALQNINADIWLQRNNQTFSATWGWLEHAAVSQTHTAIKDIHKVLFTLLKVAQQRDEYSARTALLIVYQLEILLGCRDRLDSTRLRNRVRLILGNIPESVDCINELFAVRDGLFLGSQPVYRPPLVSHNRSSVLRGQLGHHDSAIELGTAITLVLLRELIAKNAQEFVFTEHLACK